jgi:peptide/nickel transport system substrate-binding protein
LKFTTRRTIEVEGSIVASNYDTLLPVDEGGVEVIDDYTIQYTYEVPFAPAIASFTTVGGRSCNPVNQDALDEMGTDQFGLTPVLTGPFEVTEHVFGDFVRLEAFDDYWETDENGNQLPYLDEVEIQMIPEPATGINALRAGDIDFLDRPPADLVVDLEGEDDVVVNEAPGLRREGLNMNFFRDELNDPWNTQKRREALARLVDNEAYHEQVNNGRGTTTTHAISPAAEFWHQGDDIPDTQNYDPERAMEIIEEEGMKDVSFSIMAPARSERKARVLRNMFMEAGLEVEVNQVTDSGFVDAVINSTFESTILGSGAEIDPDPMFYRSFRASYLYKEEDPLDIGEENYDGVWNRAGYLNERVHELLGEQRTETDQEPRREMIHEVENILIEDVAQIFLGFDNDLTGYRDHMKGYGPVIIQQRYLGEVWLDE